jgi:hypothetical protein
MTSGAVPSLRSRLLLAALRATKRKARYLDVRLLHERIREERRTVDATPPKALKLDERVVAGIRVLTARALRISGHGPRFHADSLPARGAKSIPRYRERAQ